MEQSKNQAFTTVMAEYDRAVSKHGKFRNTHEALGVIHEEAYEVLMAIHSNDKMQTYTELSQLAAVCLKAMTMIHETYEPKSAS